MYFFFHRDMEKQESEMSSSRPIATAPPPPPSPSALPPSYEEAIATSIRMTNSPVNITSYTSRLPLSTPYIQPTVHMPHPVNSECDTSSYSPPPAYPITSGIRIVRPPRTYNLAPGAVKMQCPSCSLEIKTSTVSDHQPMAHFCCLILCILGCCLCSCLPYFMSAFMTVHHFCPRCKVYIGTWKGFESSRRLTTV
ncbi:lipopolysaccharide-induced tumor necrosis factor-alpha factor homolog isoform X2 [Aphidius gifuensis]|nr:lipopolysaccharide-induced tumor necrosis factor-alpha factor homolog isoform X2 [Aphidius gifuensis]